MTGNPNWTPISLSASIDPATSSGTHIDGLELVVWRDKDGAAHVWEDRCPHRGMRLSFGFVRGDHIACLYHGWQFDKVGQCQYIPAHPQLDVPQTIKVPRYKAMEAAGMIWTCLSDMDPAPLPDLPEVTLPIRSLYLDCDQDLALLALFGDIEPKFLAANLVEVRFHSETILVGLQHVSTTRIALHFSHVTHGKEVAYDQRIKLLKWVNSLRSLLAGTQRAAFSPGISSIQEAV